MGRELPIPKTPNETIAASRRPADEGIPELGEQIPRDRAA